MKKRLLAWVLSFALALSLLPVGVLAAEPHPFQDVPGDHWANEAVQYAYDEGLMDGVGPTTFDPSGTLTRAMSVTILGRQDGVAEDNQGENPFTDVADGQWYTPYVTWAAQEDIVGGYGDNRFGPTDPITREQMAAILYRYAQYKGYDTSETGSLDTFPDAGEVSEYAVEPMAWTVGTGLIAGMEDNTLRPQGTATRAQAATLLMRFCETVVGEPQPTPTTYTVTFDWNYDNKGTYTTATVEEGQTVQAPANPTRSGYTFAGWYTQATGGEQFDFGSAVTGDVTVYAHWNKVNGGGGTVQPPVETETFAVTFDSNGGSAVEAQKVIAGKTAKEPPVPTKDGYVFGGWINTENTSLYDFTEAVTEDVELYAFWQKVYGGDTIYRSDDSDITFDEESNTIFYNNLLLAFTTENLNDAQAEALAASVGGTIVGRVSGAVNLLQILVPTTNLENLEQLADQLMGSDVVYYASYDIPVDATDDAMDLNPWSTTGEVISDKGNEENPNGPDMWAEMIHAYTAWNYSDETSPITVGIIDSSIDENHEDFNGKITVLGEKNDEGAHGTHVAGVLAAENNAIGIRGVADHANLLFADRTPGSNGEKWNTTEYIAAIKNIIDRHAKVINMSFGFEIKTEAEYEQEPTWFQSYESYLQGRKKASQDHAKYFIAMIVGLLDNNANDFLLVQSAGNDYSDVEMNGWLSAINQTTWEMYLKSNPNTEYNLQNIKDHILIVGGLDRNNSPYHMWGVAPGSGSSYGEEIDICAPALNIYTTTTQTNNTYAYDTGTSMSAPMVSGAAAYIWSLDPTLTAKQVRDFLLSTPDRAESAEADTILQYKVLNVGDAVEKVRNELGSIGGTTCLASDNSPTSAEITIYRNGTFYRNISSDPQTGEFSAKLPEGEYKLVFQKDGYLVEGFFWYI